MVTRDCNGIVLLAAVGGYSASFSHLVFEAAALKRGLELALEAGFSSLVIKTDSSTLIKDINSNLLPFFEVGNHVKDIFFLIRNLSVLNVFFIPKKANKFVDVFAKLCIL
ncbi:hypothetical protein ACOSQ4_033152 [Xanthoceras sorbifolium]